MVKSIQNWASHFGLKNIPFGIASSKGHSQPQTVSRYENKVIFLADLIETVAEFKDLPSGVFTKTTLNSFASCGRASHKTVRTVLQNLISNDRLPSNSVEDIEDVRMHLPITVGDFTDFSCSEYHNLNAGHAVIGRRGLPPTWGFIPPGYSGRCSSIVVSGTSVRRPKGQFWEDSASAMKGENKRIIYGPCKNMDYELELGVIIGKPVEQGEILLANDAEAHIFGFVIINDWSARDIQAFEMVPLGPLNSKNSATSMSPWVITSDAVEPFRTENKSDFQNVAPHLKQKSGRAVSVNLEIVVTPQSSSSDVNGIEGQGVTTCRCNSAVMAWTFEQIIAHQASAGCGLNPGDLLGIGTVSEEEEGKRGCLLEDNIPALGTARGFLKDGDTVQFSGYCGEGVGFGDCTGKLLPALGGEACTIG